MKFLYRGITILGVLVCCLATPVLGDSANGKETCRTPADVIEGDSIDFTCLFNVDVDKHKQDFLVYGFEPHGLKQATIVAVCNWKSGHNCTVSPGYSVNTTHISDRAVVRVKAASHMHYVCSILPSDPTETPQHCTLNVKRKTKVNITCDTTSPVLAGQPSSVMCIFSTDVSNADVTVEKFSSTQDTPPEVILRWDKDNKCNTTKEGYVVGMKTATYLRINLTSSSTDQSGIYRCRSAAGLLGTSGNCSMTVIRGESDGRDYSSGSVLLSTCLFGTAILIEVPLVLICLLKKQKRYLFFVAGSTRETRNQTSDSDSGISNDGEKPHITQAKPLL